MVTSCSQKFVKNIAQVETRLSAVTNTVFLGWSGRDFSSKEYGPSNNENWWNLTSICTSIVSAGPLLGRVCRTTQPGDVSWIRESSSGNKVNEDIHEFHTSARTLQQQQKIVINKGSNDRLKEEWMPLMSDVLSYMMEKTKMKENEATREKKNTKIAPMTSGFHIGG